MDQAPKTVIALMPNLTEILFEIGAEERVVAAALADSYPPAITQLPRFNSLPLDHEKIVSIKPDLLIAVDGLNNKEDSKKLEELGIPTIFFKFQSIEDIPRAMTALTDILGLEPTGALKRFKEKSSLRQEKREVSVAILNGLEVLYSFGNDSYAKELVEIAGGHLTSGNLDGNAVVLSDEFMISHNPDVIVVASGSDSDVQNMIGEKTTWRNLSAVKNDRVYSLHPDILLRPGPRITIAIDSLRQWIDQSSIGP